MSEAAYEKKARPMNAMTEGADVARIADGLIDMEREWLTGWQGVAGAAFNVIGEGMAERGLTISYTNWNLSPLGLAVRAHLEGITGMTDAIDTAALRALLAIIGEVRSRYPHSTTEDDLIRSIDARHALNDQVPAMLDELDRLMGEVDRLKAALSPRFWTAEMSNAWHRAIPNTQKAFDDLLAAALTP